jgi:hypothetical protein
MGNKKFGEGAGPVIGLELHKRREILRLTKQLLASQNDFAPRS